MYKIILLTLIIQGCSIKKFALKTTAEIMETASLAIEEEKDIEIAKYAIFANAKTIEGMRKVDPENLQLTLIVVKALFSLSFSFIEDEYEKYRFSHPATKAKVAKRRASVLYRRAYLYGLEFVKSECSELKNPATALLSNFKKCLSEMDDDYTELLFWTGFAWSKYIFLNLGTPKSVAQLPKVVAIMDKIKKEDESIYFGNLYTFYGVYYGSRPKMLGGNAKKSLEYFNKAINYNKKTNLMAHLFKAQYYAVQQMDKKLFKKELNHVIHFKGKHHPRLGFINAISQRKARRLLAQIDEIF